MIKVFDRTPAMARLLIQASQVSGALIDEELAQLAMGDLLDAPMFGHLGAQPTARQLAVIQFVQDWRGRAMVLHGDQSRDVRNLALMNAGLHGGQTLVIASISEGAHWVRAIGKILPEARVSFFGDPKIFAKSRDGGRVEFSATPDTSADFLITNYGGVVWNDLPGLSSIHQTIVEELSNTKAIKSDWSQAIMGAFRELPRPLRLQNTNDLPRYRFLDKSKGSDIFHPASGNAALTQVAHVVSTYLWAGDELPVSLLCGGDQARSYLSQRGYRVNDPMAQMAMVGVSSHLIQP